MNITRKPPCRLDFVFAAKAPVAVILRRGPTRSVKMIIWHTNTDRFEDGEWWRGRVYEDKCGLSPDGRLFVYFGYQWKPRYVPEGVFAFTAVSRPPNFKPIALWPAGETWGGGGYFPDNKRLVLNDPAVLAAFADGARDIGVTELARHVGCSKSVVHRILVDLVASGFLVTDPFMSATRPSAGARR